MKLWTKLATGALGSVLLFGIGAAFGPALAQPTLHSVPRDLALDMEEIPISSRPVLSVNQARFSAALRDGPGAVRNSEAIDGDQRLYFQSTIYVALGMFTIQDPRWHFGWAHLEPGPFLHLLPGPFLKIDAQDSQNDPWRHFAVLRIAQDTAALPRKVAVLTLRPMITSAASPAATLAELIELRVGQVGYHPLHVPRVGTLIDAFPVRSAMLRSERELSISSTPVTTPVEDFGPIPPQELLR